MDVGFRTLRIRSAKHLSLSRASSYLNSPDASFDDSEGDDEACPLCVGNLDGDVTRHFAVHHKSSLTHRRKSHMPGINGSMMLGNELGFFLGYSRHSRTNSVCDPLSPDRPCSKDVQQDKCSHCKASTTPKAKSSETLQDEVQEEGIEEWRQRATFVRDLFGSSFL